MSHLGRATAGDCVAYKADGTLVEPDMNGWLTLAAATYYIEWGGHKTSLIRETGLASMHLAWSAALAAVITFETSNFPRHANGRDQGIGAPESVAPYDETGGYWIPEDPAGAEVFTDGSGNSASGIDVTAGGSAAGGALIHVGNLGARRVRSKLVVTTGGTLRARPHGKLGA